MIVAIAAYAIPAYWLKISYVPLVVSGTEPEVTGTKVLLPRPFRRFLDSDFGVIAPDNLFADLADTAENNERSTIKIYEDDKPIRPAHGSHADVARIAHGRFSPGETNKSSILVFSSGNNSDPQTNGWAYWAVQPGIPDSPTTPCFIMRRMACLGRF